MYWGAFGSHGKSKLVPVPPRTDSEGYQAVLQKGLVSQGVKMGGRGWIFQQDNASIHASRSTKDWLQSKNIRTMEWPAKSPDLNPMENLWGIMAHQVYNHGRQYDTKQQLDNAIKKSWSQLPQETLQNLTNSMPNRMYKVILNHGNTT